MSPRTYGVPGYYAAHQRVRDERGTASEYPCVDCGRPAQEWTYVHHDPEEVRDHYGTYSLNPDYYAPRCVRCHRRFDGMYRTATRTERLLSLSCYWPAGGRRCVYCGAAPGSVCVTKSGAECTYPHMARVHYVMTDLGVRT